MLDGRVFNLNSAEARRFLRRVHPHSAIGIFRRCKDRVKGRTHGDGCSKIREVGMGVTWMLENAILKTD